jgi:hypothetical protein
MTSIERMAFAMLLGSLASPAFAGPVAQTPAPIAGVGIGAIALIGLGYRALKQRINR